MQNGHFPKFSRFFGEKMSILNGHSSQTMGFRNIQGKKLGSMTNQSKKKVNDKTIFFPLVETRSKQFELC